MVKQRDQTGGKDSTAVGPWGGGGGNSWDDGSHNGIREIEVTYSRCIDSLRVLYDKNGKPVQGDKHGGNGGTKTETIKLDFPAEHLKSVTGHYAPAVNGGSPVIRSLTFISNRRRTFGPFGVEEGTTFSSPMGGHIVGFKGKSGWYIDAIGFHMSTAEAPKAMQKHQQRIGLRSKL